MVEYEYRLVMGFMAFYYLLFVVIGFLGIPTAVELGYENPSPFSGALALLENPLPDGIAAVIYTIIIILPLGVFATMLSLNYARGR